MSQEITQAEIAALYNTPLLDLVFKAASLHRENNNADEVQLCSLHSIKTGGCSEDCSYCPQSARYKTSVQAERLMPLEEVMKRAKAAKETGCSRFCMGAAWRQVRDNKDFDSVLDMIKGVKQEGLEVCVTLGMLTEEQAQKLKAAGLYAYNHNIDTSREHYPNVITTRSFDDRLQTLENVREAGISVCCGGILGLGETTEDRISFLHTLCNMNPPPESVPINTLVAVAGTPLAMQKKVPFFDLLRTIATARLLMPKAMIRLSAGRYEMSGSEQAFCFMAGANSIHTGEKLLTTPNCGYSSDLELLGALGLRPMQAKPRSSEP